MYQDLTARLKEGSLSRRDFGRLVGLTSKAILYTFGGFSALEILGGCARVPKKIPGVSFLEASHGPISRAPKHGELRFDKGHRNISFFYDVTLRETNGIGVELYRIRWTSSLTRSSTYIDKEDIKKWVGKRPYIPPNGTLILPDDHFFSTYLESYYIFEEFYGTDDNGNNITTDLNILKPYS